VTLSVDLRASLCGQTLDVRFDAAPGVTALFGPSGAGKTTVLRMIAGLQSAQDGTLQLGERDLWSLPPHKRQIGYVFQEPRLFPHMSVAQNLTYGGRQDFAKLVDLLGLRPLLSRRPAKLSGGEKQRVALGRALMSGPELILMDEPLAALDAPRKADILPFIAALAQDTAVPIVYVTHAVPEVVQLADQMVILSAGKVAHRGDIQSIFANPETAQFFGRRESGAVLNCRVIAHADGVTQLDTPAGRVLLPENRAAVGAKVRLRIPAQDIILSQEPLLGQSALNALKTVVTEVKPLPGGSCAVILRAGEATLWADVTPLSVTRLGLVPGESIYAVFKATAVALTA